jgi:hypothetical protein
MSANAGDLGNRGHLDLVLGNGDPTLERIEPTVLYQRMGEGGYDGRYHDVTFTAGLSPWGKGHGVNLADLGGDGRLCLVVCHGGLYPGDLMRTTVHRPRQLPGHYLNIRLEGVDCHAQAHGARIRLRSGGRDQYRWLDGGSGFGCLPLEQHFGLGPLGGKPTVEQIEVRWPDGRVELVEGGLVEGGLVEGSADTSLPIDTTLHIVQGRGIRDEDVRIRGAGTR